MFMFEDYFSKEEMEKYLEFEEQMDEQLYNDGFDMTLSEIWCFLEHRNDFIWLELPFKDVLHILQFKVSQFIELWAKNENWDEVIEGWERGYTIQI